ncbi:MAG TPA: hypothetical protein VLL97_07585, partial [Acidobacteriota bacterium]|nr:hypothetical protein [Acidobacteriota bacterium]
MGTNSIKIAADNNGKCWVGFSEVHGSLMTDLKAEPFAAANAKGERELAAFLASLRREKIERPVIYIGAGTCGLGAGAAKTIDAARDYLSRKNISADIVEAGCNGMCSDEPIVDIQVPGKNRVSFGSIAADKVEALFDAVLKNNIIPEDLLLGQYRTTGSEAWEKVPFLEDHPFLKKQVRVVLALSGIIDPGNINEYIAQGGYSSIARIL